MKKMVTILKNKFTVHELRKGRSGRKVTMRTPENIAPVRRGWQQELLEFLVLLPRDMIRILRNHLSTQSSEKTRT